MASWEAPTPLASENVNSVKAQIVQTIRSELYKRTSDILHALPGASLKFLSVASDLIYVVIVPVLAFFFIKDGELIRGHMLGLVDAGPLRALVDSVLEDIHLLLAHYMRALVLLSLNTFVFYSIFLHDHGDALRDPAGGAGDVPGVHPDDRSAGSRRRRF